MKAISTFRKWPYWNFEPLIVNVRALKSGWPKMAAEQELLELGAPGAHGAGLLGAAACPSGRAC
jgi:hypothetical protein